MTDNLEIPAEFSRKVGRLALRVEGSMWSAYYALPDTMDGALFIGSVAMRFVQDPERKDAFINLMRGAVGDLMFELFGTRPTWPDGVQPAPEHERGGNG